MSEKFITQSETKFTPVEHYDQCHDERDPTWIAASNRAATPAEKYFEAVQHEPREAGFQRVEIEPRGNCNRCHNTGLVVAFIDTIGPPYFESSKKPNGRGFDFYAPTMVIDFCDCRLGWEVACCCGKVIPVNHRWSHTEVTEDIPASCDGTVGLPQAFDHRGQHKDVA